MTDPVTLESRWRSSPVQLGAAALMFLVVAWSARFPLAEENQMLLSGGMLVVLFLFGWTEWLLGEFNRVAVIVLGAYLSLRYWMFRTTETLSFTDVWDFIFLMLLYLAETYGIFTHLVGLFVNVAPMQRRSPALPADSRLWPSVDVLIPTYNEPVDMVTLTLTACTQRAMALFIACDIHPLNNLRVLKYLKGELGQEQPAIDAWIGHWIGEGFTALEAMAKARDGQFLFGDTPTIADVCLVPQMYNARRFNVPLDAFPTLVRADANAQKLVPFVRAHPDNQETSQ